MNKHHRAGPALPGNQLRRWREKLERLWARASDRRQPVEFHSHQPHCPAENQATFWLELAGFNQKDVRIEAQGRTLHILAEQDQGRWGRRIAGKRTVYRTLRLPPHLDPKGTTATMRDGLLRLDIPYRMGWKREIPVQTA